MKANSALASNLQRAGSVYLLRGLPSAYFHPSLLRPLQTYLAQPSHTLPPFSSMPLPPADDWLAPIRPDVPTLYRAAAWALVLSAVRSSSGLPSFRAGLAPRTCRTRRDYWGFYTQMLQVTTSRAICVLH